MSNSAFISQSALPGAVWDLDRPYFLPMGIVRGAQAVAMLRAGVGLPLTGHAAFGAMGVIWRDGAEARMSVVDVAHLSACPDDAVCDIFRRIGARRPKWAGLSLDRPLVMGIVNATPDSFSDGGDNYNPRTAIDTALAMVGAGADIIDVGGESTRPGAAQVGIDEEIKRVLPVVSALAPKGIAVSIDTRHAAVMAAATQAGATIINDVAALREPGALEVAAKSGAAVCLMHMLGEPGTMQNDPTYTSAPLDVYDFLAGRIAAAQSAGIGLDRIAVDPGIGFGKTSAHNIQLIDTLALLHGLGVGILLGVSRKRFVAALSRDELPKQRFPGSLAAALACLDLGAQIVRVHDVAETVQAVTVWRAVHGA